MPDTYPKSLTSDGFPNGIIFTTLLLLLLLFYHAHVHTAARLS